jgi:2-polyprenyl-3-methyl-5-hydroxy-6-metoxy-1,4-benzoquinol methylase
MKMESDPKAYFRHERREVAEFLPREYRRVLEVGCGEGVFSAHLKAPCEYWGIEPSAGAAARASRKLYRVLGGTYQEVYGQLPDHYFDLVICNDVIEHLPDHDEFLRAIQRKMDAGGRLVGSIPNVRYVWNLYGLLVEKDWRYADEGTLDRTHLRFFTEKSWRRTLAEHGFLVEELRGINESTGAIWSKVLKLIEAGTLGHYRDIKFLQFGFRARRG